MDTRLTNRLKTFFTRAEVAQLFEVAPNTVNRWVLAGRLPSVLTPGGRRRYPAAAIVHMLEEQMRAAEAYAPPRGSVPRGKNTRRASAKRPAVRATRRA